MIVVFHGVWKCIFDGIYLARGNKRSLQSQRPSCIAPLNIATYRHHTKVKNALVPDHPQRHPLNLTRPILFVLTPPPSTNPDLDILKLPTGPATPNQRLVSRRRNILHTFIQEPYLHVGILVAADGIPTAGIESLEAVHKRRVLKAFNAGDGVSKAGVERGRGVGEVIGAVSHGFWIRYSFLSLLWPSFMSPVPDPYNIVWRYRRRAVMRVILCSPVAQDRFEKQVSCKL